MAKRLQLRRGTTAQHAVFTGAVGEVTIDTDKDALVVHDGMQAGGFPAARESDLNDHTTATGNVHNISFSELNDKPTTIEGYGITNSISNHSDLSGAGTHTHDELDADMSKIGDIRYTMAEVDSTWLVADDRIYSENDYPTLSTVIGKKEVFKPSRLEVTGVCESVIYAYSKYFAAHASNLYVSSDGVMFELRIANAASKLLFGNGIIVGIYDGLDQSFRSTDGITFTAHTYSLGGSSRSFDYCNGLFIIGTTTREICTSPDGITWTNRTTIPEASGYITSISYGAGVYVACLDTGSIYTSPDLSSWTLRTSQFGTAPILSSIYSNGIFVACGELGKISTSVNGATWTARSSGGTFKLLKVFYRNDRFEIYPESSLGVLASLDGLSWSGGGNIFTYSSSIKSIIDTSDTTIFAGYRLSTALYHVIKKVANAEYSAEKYWKTSTISGFNNSICYFPSRYLGQYVIANSSVGFLVSSDLVTWQTVSAVTAFGSEGADLVVYGEGILVAAKGNKIATSSNGTTWTARTYPSLNGIYSLSYNNGTFVAAGNMQAATSPDGITWTLISNFTGMDGMCAAGSGLPTIIAGSSGKISISNDFNATWSSPSSASILASGIGSGTINAICQGTIGGTSGFMIANSSRRMATTIDGGVTWTAIPDPGFVVHELIYNEGKFVAVGYGGKIAYSSDEGNSWEIIQTNNTTTYYGCCAGLGRIVTVAKDTVAICNTFGVESPEFLVPNVTSQYVPAYIKGE